MAIKVLNEFLPPAEQVRLGAIKVGNSLNITNTGTLDVSSNMNVMARTTNCISEIPYTSNVTVEAGKFIAYAGTGYSFVDNASNVLPEDREITGTTDGEYYVCVDSNTNLVLVDEYSNTYSLPLAKVTVLNSEITSAEEIYVGFGHTDTEIFVFSGVKGLIPNGRLSDGELNNAEFEYTQSRSVTVTADGTYFIGCNGDDIVLLDSDTIYNSSLNYNVLDDTSVPYTRCGRVTVEDGVITEFNTRPTFYAADYYELQANFPSIDTLGDLAWKDKISTSDIVAGGIAQSAITDLDTTLAGKQDVLTFDDIPAEDSDNPVKSSGIYGALTEKQDTLTAGTGIDITNNTISENSIAYVTYNSTLYADITSLILNKKIILCKYNNSVYQYTTTSGNYYYFTCLETSSTTKQLSVDTSNTWAAGNTSIQAAITGAATTITSDNLTTNRALISNASGKVAVSDTTNTELAYVHGVTSAIQTQIDNKVTKNNAIDAATKCKITYDAKGLITAGADLEATDIPNLTLSKISDVTATVAEVNTLDGITASTAELNTLDGITATVTELNYTDGVTSNIQTQLDSKATDNNVVHLTGTETITGSKTFNTTDVPITIVNPDQTMTDTESTKYGTIAFNDGDGNRLCNFASVTATWGYGAYFNLGSFANYKGFNILYRPDSQKVTYQVDTDTMTIPTPTEDTTTSKQADTVGARNTKLQSYALDNNVVHKTGSEEITGTKTFSADQKYACSDTNADLTQQSTSNEYWWGIRYVDKNNMQGGLYQYKRTTDGTAECNIQARALSTNPWSKIAIYQNADGTDYATGPTPTEDTTNSIQLDTVGARNTKLQGYQTTITGAASTITSNDLTASKALISNASGKVAISDTTDTELGYVHGVTSAIQTQLDNKQSTISDLETIRTGASKGATALQSSDIIDNTESTATNKVLSANQGKVLQEQINDLKAVGRFLSIWNCTTGKPTTDPETLPYPYHTGDYYLVGTVNSSGTNYKPNGSSYTGAASTTVETETVKVADMYYYDGSVWQLSQNSQRTVSFADIAGQPTDNTNLASALNDKLTKNTAITAATKCKITYDTNGLVTAGTDLQASDIPNITLSKISDVTATASELNTLDGITASTAELNILDGVTASAAEINILDGVTATTAELNYVNGVTSNIQTQLDSKATDTDAVHKTGNETITGIKTNTQPITAAIQTANTANAYQDVFKETDSNLDTSTNPSYSKTYYYAIKDASNRYLGYISNTYKTDGKSSMSLNVRTRNTDNSDNAQGQILIEVARDGTLNTSAPTPTQDSTNSTQIDTVGARNTKLANYPLDNTVVHLAGTETISGAKTFSNNITITDGKSITIKNSEGNDSVYTSSKIEFKPVTTDSYGGYIDFHYAGSSADNTSRIIEDASGQLNINGNKFYSSLPSTVSTTPTDDNTTSKQIDTVGARNTKLQSYQTLITSSNKLDADLLSEGSNNKLVSQAEKNTWNAKQDALSQGTNITIANNTVSTSATKVTIRRYS